MEVCGWWVLVRYPSSLRSVGITNCGLEWNDILAAKASDVRYDSVRLSPNLSSRTHARDLEIPRRYALSG
jgi:hypothetical protein